MTLDDVALNEVRRLIRRANFRLKAEEDESAFKLFERALEYFPKSIEILNILGALSIKMGKLDEAIRYYRDSIVIRDELNTQIELGYALLLNKQVEEAQEIFSSLDRSDPDVKAGFGISLVLSNQNPREAADLLNQVDRYDLGFDTSTFLGLAYYQLGMYNQALTEFRKNYGSWKNRHAIGVQYLGMNSNSTANRSFQEAINKYQENFGKDKIDQSIMSKMKYDLILSETNSNVRKQALLTLIDEETKTLEIYLALIATQYDISGYDDQLIEYLEAAKKYVDSDQTELIAQLDTWMEKSREGMD